jgi:tripartite-type tricarboxylate transporter receptor subunit TctC
MFMAYRLRARKALWFAAALGSVLAANTASAQDWPLRQPIRVISPASAGSTSDIMARIVFEQVGRQVGQTVVVENHGGAGTTTGMAVVAKSVPDGYTILVNSTSYVVVASTYARLPYNPYEDMLGIALLAHFPFVVATSLKYKNLDDLVAAGQIQPSPVTAGSLGIGSSGHLAMERLLHAAKFQATIVPFRGAPEAVAELAAGRIDMYAGVLPNVLELAKSGQINLVGVMSSRRSALVPDVPTTIEAGYPGSDYNFWMGSYLPAKTPRPIVERLNAEVGKALQDQGLRTKIRQLGGEIEVLSVEQFNAFIARERAVNAEIVKLIGYQPQ